MVTASKRVRGAWAALQHENRWEQIHFGDIWKHAGLKERENWPSLQSLWTADQLEMMVYLTSISVQLDVTYNLNSLYSKTRFSWQLRSMYNLKLYSAYKVFTLFFMFYCCTALNHINLIWLFNTDQQKEKMIIQNHKFLSLYVTYQNYHWYSQLVCSHNVK